MTSAFGSPRSRRLTAVVGLAAASALALAGCAGGGNGGGSAASGIIVGTTDKVTFLDPAGSYDNGSFALMNQVFPFIMNTKLGSSDVSPDIATSADFTSPTEYTVKLKSGLTFANGHKLTSSDVKFTFERQLKIADPNGPSSLLSNLDSVDAPDATTVVFNLKDGNDQTFPQVLSSPAGPIVDEQSFSATKVTSDKTIVADKAFAGQYQIDNYNLNTLVQLSRFDGYKGLLGAAKTSSVTLKYYASSSNLKLDIQKGDIDVASRSLTPTDVASLRDDKKVQVIDGPGGETRYIVFNFDTMPYGAKTAEADPAKSLAVRQAMADLIDRKSIADEVYKGTYTPLYSWVPDGLTGAAKPLESQYGDGNGGPSSDKAKQTLTAAGITSPVTLKLQYNPDHYGESSGDEYAQVKSQLEDGGLFTVDLQSTEWTQYSKDRTKDVYPMYQLGWFPDYSDADNYLSPFFLPTTGTDGQTVPGGFLANHFNDDTLNDQINAERTESDADARAKDIEEVQSTLANDLPTLPLLQGAQILVTGTDVKGAVLDASFKFRFGSLTK